MPPLREALALFEEIDNARLRAGTSARPGPPSAPPRHFTSALRIARDIGDRLLEWELLVDAGTAHLDAGSPTEALAHARQALTATREVRDRHGEAIALSLAGRALLSQDDTAAEPP